MNETKMMNNTKAVAGAGFLLFWISAFWCQQGPKERKDRDSFAPFAPVHKAADVQNYKETIKHQSAFICSRIPLLANLKRSIWSLFFIWAGVLFSARSANPLIMTINMTLL